MEKLFDIQLQYKPDMTQVTSPEGRLGKHLGSGDGTVIGEKLKGGVRWDIYEKGGVVTGEKRCQTNITGLIVTDDGSTIQFDSVGFGMVPDSSQPNKWSMAATRNFNTSAETYLWLNNVLAVWKGDFDME